MSGVKRASKKKSRMETPTAPPLLLSNDDIYNPLSSYTNPVICNQNKKRIKAFKDYQVCDFFENVSKVYTGNDAKVSWVSSCSSSATWVAAATSAINRSAHLDGKIFARTLVLGAVSKKRKKKQRGDEGNNNRPRFLVGSISHSKRKQICKTAQFFTAIHHEKNHLQSDSSILSKTNPHRPLLPSASTLEKLNCLWNNYAEQLLGPILRPLLGEDETYSSSNNKLDAISRNDDVNAQVSQIIDKHFEICGAIVHIIACPSHSHYKGKTGMIVEETRNTWRMITSSTSITKNITPNHENQSTKKPCSPARLEGSKPEETTSMKVLVVPKRNSTLALQLTVGGHRIGLVIGAKHSKL